MATRRKNKSSRNQFHYGEIGRRHFRNISASSGRRILYYDRKQSLRPIDDNDSVLFIPPDAELGREVEARLTGQYSTVKAIPMNQLHREITATDASTNTHEVVIALDSRDSAHVLSIQAVLSSLARGHESVFDFAIQRWGGVALDSDGSSSPEEFATRFLNDFSIHPATLRPLINELCARVKDSNWTLNKIGFEADGCHITTKAIISGVTNFDSFLSTVAQLPIHCVAISKTKDDTFELACFCPQQVELNVSGISSPRIIVLYRINSATKEKKPILEAS